MNDKHENTKLVRPQGATSKMGITLHGQEYVVACDAGEEKKLAQLVSLVDKKLSDVALRSAGASETRLFMLTCLLLADELVEARRLMTESRKLDESLMIAAVDHLTDRVRSIASRVDAAAE